MSKVIINFGFFKRIKQLKQKEGGINDLKMQLDARMEENNRLTQHISRYTFFG